MLSLLLPALALANPEPLTYSAGGLSVHRAPIAWDVPGVAQSHRLGCLGGQGFRVRDGKRLGAEGSYCLSPGVDMAFGGVQTGWSGRRAGLYGTAFSTFGLGWVGVDGPGGEANTAFAFARPTAGLGFPLGPWGGLEASAYLMLPLNLVGTVSGDVARKYSFPHAGLQVSLLFGDLTRRRKERAAPVAAPPPPGAPASRPPPPPARPAPIQPSDLPPARHPAPPPPEDQDDRPLAIPT